MIFKNWSTSCFTLLIFTITVQLVTSYPVAQEAEQEGEAVAEAENEVKTAPEAGKEAQAAPETEKEAVEAPDAEKGAVEAPEAEKTAEVTPEAGKGTEAEAAEKEPADDEEKAVAHDEKLAAGEKKTDETVPDGAADKKPADGGAADDKKPADGGAADDKKPADGGAADDKKPEDGSAKNRTSETEKGKNETSIAKKSPKTVTLTLPPDATTPQNIVTDHYGAPVKDSQIITIPLPKGEIMKVLTESWRTYYTRPATKPGCLCLTRGPLPKFKLIGNLHFPKIKVTPERYVTMPTEPPTTLCPPCICDCGVTPKMDLDALSNLLE